MATNEAEAGAGAVVSILPAPRTARTGPARTTAALHAYVLHRHDWSESSLIVELFTRERGRLVVVARGAKRPTSNFRPVLLPFQPLHAQLGKAGADEHNEVQSLRGAEWAGGQPLLPASALLSGFYLNELLLKLLARQDPHPVLFDAYADTLAALARAEDEAAALRAFELMLLREAGVLPELSLTTLGVQPLQALERYTVSAEAGVLHSAQGPTGAQWVALEAALSHGSAAALRQACAAAAARLRAPLRELLHYHLGSSRLNTRQVWQSVQRLNRVPPAHEPIDRP